MLVKTSDTAIFLFSITGACCVGGQPTLML